MADDIQVTPGAGATVAADDVAGVLYQRVKLSWGADGSAADVQDVDGARLPMGGAAIGRPSDGAWDGVAATASMIALLKKMATGGAVASTVALANGEGVKGQVGGIVANPSATFTRPGTLTGYQALMMVANSATAGSVSYGPIGVGRVAAGSFQVDRARLVSAHTSGLAGVSFRARLWSAAPTYSSGDGATYGVASGGANYLGSLSGVFEQFGDFAVAMLLPDYGSPCVKLGAGVTNVFWDLQTMSPFTPQASKTFALTLEAKQD